jgi:hypothetical protein
MYCDLQVIFENPQALCGVGLIGKNIIGKGTCNSNKEYECQEVGPVIRVQFNEAGTCEQLNPATADLTEFLYRNGVCENEYMPFTFAKFRSSRYTLFTNGSIKREFYNQGDCANPITLEKIYNGSGCFNILGQSEIVSVLGNATQELSSNDSGICQPGHLLRIFLAALAVLLI